MCNVGDDLEAACEKNKRKVPKAHLAALLRKVYYVTIQSSKSKPEHIKCLAKEISNDNGAKLQGYCDSLPAAAAGDGDHNDGDRDDQIGSEEEGDDDGPDHGEEYYEKRVAKYHVEDRAEDGGPRLCFGTVVDSGFPDNGPRKCTGKWNLTKAMLLFMGPMKEAKLKI